MKILINEINVKTSKEIRNIWTGYLKYIFLT